MIVFGLISSLFDLLTFAVLLLVFHAGEAMFQTAWFVISVLTEIAVVLLLRTRGPAFHSSPSSLLPRSTLTVAAIILTISFLNGPSLIFGFVSPSALQIGVIITIVAGYIVGTELAERWFFWLGQILILQKINPDE